MSSKLDEISRLNNLKVKPFAMLRAHSVPHFISEARNQCNLSDKMLIEDAYPCTDLQEGFMAFTVKQPGSYVYKYVYQIPQSVDISRFKVAWEATIAMCTNLRTRIIVLEGSTTQVVIKEKTSWEWDHCPDLAASLARGLEMTYGSRLCQYTIVKDPENLNYFIWAMHHAVHDGWTMRLTIETLQRFYYFGNSTPALHSHARFVRYTQELDSVNAAKYWDTQLKHAKRCAFPLPKARSGSVQQLLQPRAHMRKKIAFLHHNRATITESNLLRAAWAIVLARYSDSDDVCFGTIVCGRHAPIGLDRISGPVLAILPIRARFEKDSTVEGFLRQIQKQAYEMVPYEHFGLQRIARLSPDAKEACNFSSLLVIQPASSTKMLEVDTQVILEPITDKQLWEGHPWASHTDYALILQLHIHDKHLDFHVSYNPGVLVEVQVTALFHHFDRVVQQLLSPGKMLLHDVSLAGPWDLQQATAWNAENPEIINNCVHSMIARQAQQQPEAPAICAWDGKLTYSELNAAADRLAHHLAGELGVVAEVLVHVCFEKSVWFFVAILAINKAGGAWVPLDPSHPIQRQQEVVRQTRAKLALASSANAEMCVSLGLAVVEVTAALDKAMADNEERAKGVLQPPSACMVTAQNAAYVLFTSGSTGTPKGLVIEHGSLCTSQIALAARLRLTADMRMLQFASYVFDSCIGEIIAVLLSGACVCVPSDEMRWNSLCGFIRDMCVSSALLTPSFIRTIKPAEVPSLSLLILASESPSQDILDTWLGNTRLINAWGPAEICVISTLHEWKSANESPLTVGRPVGGSCWIVDPENYEHLAPIGCVGEVVVQGPTLLREYLSNREKTEASIVTPVPVWMPRRTEAKWDRFFKTGDLAFYNPDGTIEFIGRKDTQVKIRGQRVELEEVEYNVRTMLKGIKQVVVDVFQTEARVSLAAYFCFSWEIRRVGRAGKNEENGMINDMDDLFLPLTDQVERQVRGLARELALRLPNYMVPTMFVPCRYMPFSTKLDRGKLRRKTAALDRESIARYSLTDLEKQAPETALEAQMQQLWASVLKVPAETIGREENFLQIGGDSISAIHLVSLARRHGFVLTVTSIFEDARLSRLAAMVGSGVASVAPPPPFSLLPEGRIDELLDQTRRQCSLSEHEVIEDAYPCTPLQEGLMALAIKQPGSYMITWLYKLSPHVDVTQFKDAWERTVALCVNLRTRIILADGCSFQVVVRDEMAWEAWELPGGSEVDSTILNAHKIEMIPGSRLWRYALTEGADGQSYFTLVAHHAVFDGWSIGLTMQRLQCFYEDAVAPTLEPYSRFIQYVGGLDREASARYWKAQLHEAKLAAFPPRRPGAPITTVGAVTRSLTKPIAFRQSASSSVTKATVLRAAWAIVLARYCDTRDVCFGASVSGRHAPVLGLESMSGPVVATVPVRVRLNAEQRVTDFLCDMQAHASAMTPHEQFGLQHIIKLSEDARAACDFASVLVIQPAEILAGIHSADPIMAPAATGGLATAYEHFGYPLVVQALLGEKDVEFSATYDSEVLAEAQVTALFHHFDCVVQQLLSSGETLLCNISLAGPWDLQQATAWNGEGPEALDDCIHLMIARQAQQRPDAPAICAWDGEFTHRELNTAADRLARHLVKNLGVIAEVLVHVCFEKSAWFFISILAINKAGGVWVPLDPSHPTQRQQEIVRQTGAKLALASSTNAEMCKGLGLAVVEVTMALDKAMADVEDKDMADDEVRAKTSLQLPSACEVTAQNAAYVLFTSGSTGTPKGLVMEHGSVCTSQVTIAARLGLTADVRMLQFASYAFDVFIFESICSLISGACICVPSEETRLTNLEDFISATAVNWIDLTPTFARTLDSTKVQNLQVLVIGGEPAGQDILRKWVGKTRLINAWGPAETCVISACHEYKSISESPQTIGRPVGGSCWIVNPENYEQLAPIGCIGEIVIQGPTLLREYLSDPKKTRESIINPVPEWMSQCAKKGWGRLFKTGDLAFYNSDGTIEFIGRKDTQVKIRGQRVELGEVEYCIQMMFEELEQVAVDVLQTETGVSLIAYLCYSRETRLAGRSGNNTAINKIPINNMDDLFLPLTDKMERQVRDLARELGVKLPGYMVPKIFVPCRYMPFITSTKLDRSKLRRETAALDRDSIARYSLTDLEKQAPETALEAQMQQLWASVLKVPAETIGRDDNFLQIGGDSISAIRLVLLARRHGFVLTVPSIFEDARLSRLAATVGQYSD